MQAAVNVTNVATNNVTNVATNNVTNVATNNVTNVATNYYQGASVYCRVYSVSINISLEITALICM